MNRDRVIQLLGVVLAAGGLMASVLLMPTINSQRRDLQLSFDLEVGDRQPPKYAIAAAALGSFRGMAVNVLWYRAEQLKNEGKFWELNTLGEWITTLQPRFPQVWSFQAWNLAYNISVQTHTPEERWNWVHRGVRLLREEGIPNNPTSVRLYRELGWLYLNKIDMTVDEMHWYYKLQVAEEWQQVLGVPTQGADQVRAVVNFSVVAEAAERYHQLSRPTREMRGQLATLAGQNPPFAGELETLSRRGLVRMNERLPRLIEQARSDGQPRLAEQLEGLLAQTQSRLQRSQRPPLNLLFEEAPASREVVRQLREIGLEPDERTLRSLGRLQMYLLYFSPQVMAERRAEMELTERDIALLRILVDERNREGMGALIVYLRADALVNYYRMDPQFMLQLMEQFGPIDWRHPASHAVYWSAMGMEMVDELRDLANVDVMNTERQIIHGLQSLMRSGRVNYDPMTGQVDLLPEPIFIPAYEQAIAQAEQRAIDLGMNAQRYMESFEGGHENFLLAAIAYSYLYGDIRQANYYYRRASELYGFRDGRPNPRYGETLHDLVITWLQSEFGEIHVARQFIDSMLIRAFREGLGHGRMDVFDRFATVAAGAYERYQEMRDYTAPNAPRQRLQLPPTFRLTFNETYKSFMHNTSIPLLERSRIYHNTPDIVRVAVYADIRETLAQHTEQAGFEMDRAFPPPPGWERDVAVTRPATPDTVERR